MLGDHDAYFWNTQGVAELDLLVFVHGQRFGFEFKYADAPSLTKSLRIAREDLKLRRALVVHPGQESFPLEDWAEAVAIRHLRQRLLLLVRSAEAGAPPRRRASPRPRR